MPLFSKKGIGKRVKYISMTVPSCMYCPFLQTDGVSKTIGTCRNTENKRPVDIQTKEIPTWCPLPDKEEK